MLRRGKYSHEEIHTLINRALAYHEAMAALVRRSRRSYDEPKELPVHPELAHDPGETITVMVRDGDGAIGMRYVHTKEESRLVPFPRISRGCTRTRLRQLWLTPRSPISRRARRRNNPFFGTAKNGPALPCVAQNTR